MWRIAKYKEVVLWKVLIFILPFIIYLSSFRHVFMFGDDQNMIINNIFLRDWKYFSKFFTENFFAGSGTLTDFWRPFLLIVYSLIVHIAGVKPWVIHLSSILFHSLCGVFIFILFSRILPKTIKPAIIALIVILWSVHPMHVEELGGVAGNVPYHLFWMLFGLFSFLIFEGKNRLSWYFVSLASFILALFSKESAVIFPGLLFGMHITGIKTGLFKKLRIKDYIFRHFAFFLIASFYILVRLTFLNFSNTLNFYGQPNIFTQNLYYRFLTLFTILNHGLRVIFLPWSLHPERSWPVFTNFFFLEVTLSVIILAALIIVAAKSWKKNPLFSFGIFWFFFSYLPMSNIVAKINSLVCDHWFYVPSVGIFLSLASLLSLIKNNFYQKIALGSLAAVVTVFTIITFSLIPHYKNSKSYCRYVLAYEPDSGRTWNNLAMSLTGPEEEEEALRSYLRAIEISDIYPQTHHNLANLYLDLGRYDLAQEQYLAAIRLDSKFYRAYLGLGKIYLEQGRTQDAVYYFKKAMEAYPYLPKDTVNFINKLISESG